MSPVDWGKGHGTGLVKLSGTHWEKQQRGKRGYDPHGVWLFTGPKGAGKSLLAHAFSLLLSRGQFRNPDGNCICGDPFCDATWTIYTMHESPTLPEYGAWAKRLDLQELLDVGGEGENHIVIYIDEITQYFNSRRGMIGEVIKMLNRVTLTRKKKIILIGTGISIDWIDVRLRDQATIVYNCWTPNKGETVWANIHRLALGHLPPHMRRMLPETRWWPTAWARGKYNTDELIDADADMTAAKTEPIFHVQTEGGLWLEKRLSEVIAETIEKLLMEECVSRISAIGLVERIRKTYGPIPVNHHWVKDWMRSVGFMLEENSDNFILGISLADDEE